MSEPHLYPQPPHHRLKVPHLVFGLLFLGLAGVWALVVSDWSSTRTGSGPRPGAAHRRRRDRPGRQPGERPQPAPRRPPCTPPTQTPEPEPEPEDDYTEEIR